MKQIIKTYSFSVSAKTVTLTDFTSVRLERLQLIVDTTTNKILYNFADPTVASATVATNVITLSALQGGENNTDKLQVIYDSASDEPSYDVQPVSASSLPLPTGAAQESGNLASIKTDTDSIVTNTSNTAANTSTTATNTNNTATNTSNINTATGAKGDAAATDSTSSWSVIAILKGLYAALTGGNQQVQGNVASAATDSGNPVKTGGVFKTSSLGLTNGQRGDTQITTEGYAKVQIWAGGNNNTQQFVGNGDANSGSVFLMGVANLNQVSNGNTWDRLRTPTIFKTATATASGDTAVWTPTSGKKFRLMRYMIEVSNDAATSGGADIDIILRDSTTGMAAALTVYVPTSGGTTMGAISTHWVDLGNGPLSAAANNVLNVNLSAALTAGKIRVVAIGCEE